MKIHFEQVMLQRGEFRLELDLAWEDEVLLLRGPSGSGKSLLLRALAGLERPTRGRLTLDGQVWASAESLLPAEQRPISLMFQDYRLFPHLNVMQNLRFGGADQARVRELADRFGLTELLGRGIGRLSGGEKQRVALLRTLLRPCRLLLLDEPTAALNPELRAFWISELRNYRREAGLQLIYVSHHAGEMALWPEAASLELDHGRLIRLDKQP